MMWLIVGSSIALVWFFLRLARAAGRSDWPSPPDREEEDR